MEKTIREQIREIEDRLGEMEDAGQEDLVDFGILEHELRELEAKKLEQDYIDLGFEPSTDTEVRKIMSEY